MNLLYLFIALGATTLGSMAGLGGGVIIKPILDFLGDYNLSTISVLSSFTVFSMAIVSIIKQIRYKFKIEVRKTVLIGIGSKVNFNLNATNNSYSNPKLCTSYTTNSCIHIHE